MITLERDGIVMEVATQLQASVFIRNGYSVVENAKPVETAANAPVVDASEANAEAPVIESDVEASASTDAEVKPKRRRRKSV